MYARGAWTDSIKPILMYACRAWAESIKTEPDISKLITKNRWNYFK